MRIAIEARYLAGKRLGVGRYLYNLLRFFPEISDKHDYYLYSDGRELDKSINNPKIHYRTLKGPRKLIWRHFLLPLEQIKKKYELLFIPSYSAPILKTGKTVVTIHDIIPIRFPEWSVKKERIRFATIIKHTAKRADYIIAASQATKNDLLELTDGSNDRIEVIYLGVDDHFRVLETDQLSDFISKNNLHQPYILYVGAIHPRRNIDQLIQAFSILKKENNIPHKLILIGLTFHTHLSNQLTEWINSSGVSDQISRIGYVSDDDLVKFYNLADIFIYPSSYEGFGLPVLEAMACGTPVITSKSSSLTEVAGDAALLVKPGDVEELADAIRRLIEDSACRQEMINHGFKQARQFTWLRAAQKTVELFEKVSTEY